MNPLNVSLIYILICLAISHFGRYRRFGFWGYFFASVLLTPPIGALLVIASSARSSGDLNR